MKKVLCIFVIYVSVIMNVQAQKEKLNVYSFPEVEKLHKQNPKPIVIFIYTNWCKFCHAMISTTFKNEEISTILNEKYYFVKLNAEHQKPISFLGKTFVFKPSGNRTGIHELAEELAYKKGTISYPTTTILNKNYEIELQMSNYVNTQKMKEIVSLL